jgi:hypothetical protein
MRARERPILARDAHSAALGAAGDSAVARHGGARLTFARLEWSQQAAPGTLRRVVAGAEKLVLGDILPGLEWTSQARPQAQARRPVPWLANTFRRRELERTASAPL